LVFLSTSTADYQDEIGALRTRLQQLAGGETGLSDSQRFKEIVDLTYDYTMLNYPEYATYLGDPRGQDRWTDQSEAATAQRKEDAKTLLTALTSINARCL